MEVLQVLRLRMSQFHHQEESFIKFKLFHPVVKTNFPPTQNVNEAHGD